MNKIIIFITTAFCMLIYMTSGVSAQLNNKENPETNPIKIQLSYKQVGPLETDRVDLNISDLKYKGAILLECAHPAFGGFSDLIVSQNRNFFLAVSDMGFWLKGRLRYDNNNMLIGAEPEAELGQLLSIDGNVLGSKNNADAEALSRATGSGFLVAFERQHRINYYNSSKGYNLSGKPTRISQPEGLKKLSPNGGIESLTLLPDGRLLMIAEGDTDYEKPSYAAVGINDDWIEMKYQRQDDYRPTSVAALPGGDILMLERSYTGPGSLKIRFCLIKKPEFKTGKTLIPEKFLELPPLLPLDNFEGLDTITTDDGKTFIYIISDDNYSPLQHTILMMFEMDKRNKK